MARKVKARRVCMEPRCRVFKPMEGPGGYVQMSVEQLEALRLCDLEGMEQEQAAVSMDISRGTLQRILYEARRLSAEALCEGREIIIGGGHYHLAEQVCTCATRCKSCRFPSTGMRL